VLGLCTQHTVHNLGLNTEVDPHMFKALNMAQYATQYLQSCQDTLRSKQETVVDALKVFQEEEELLDFEIAKYRWAAMLLRFYYVFYWLVLIILIIILMKGPTKRSPSRIPWSPERAGSILGCLTH
jgi:hypothetical protein